MKKILKCISLWMTSLTSSNKRVTLYGAALALEVRADSSQKVIYRQKIDELNKKARALFDSEYVQITKVDYLGKELPLSGYPLPGARLQRTNIFRCGIE